MIPMIFTETDLDNLSKLARIDITPDEKSEMLADMQAILGYISEINDVQGEVITVKESLYNVVREDIVINDSGTKSTTILEEAPLTKDGYVEVMQVLK